MRSMYMDLYQEEGIDSLSTKAMNTYAEDGKTLDSKSILTRTASFKILLSTHPKILDSVLKGTILADARKDQELRDVLRKLKASGPYSDRKYIASKSGRLSKQKVKNVEEFLLGLRKRLEDIDSSLYDQPLECPLVEIGYTYQSRKRLDDYRNHRGSNYIMNLFDATCNTLWPARFKVHQFVIFVCTEPTYAVVAEILFTRICQCYIKNGGGFTYCPPGRSNKSAYNYTSVDWERFWDFNKGITDVAKNLKADEMKWEAYLEKKRQEKKENENVVQKMLAKTDSIKQGLVGLYETEAEMNVHLETIQLMASNDESTV
ncbi:unnamed protein product [Zymoseptoria tritici ST99CH_1A5]|uniref:Uncharacterized protein n=1 Tax=Zymoseptoria tritici ST99CH_1A5 TaxID=1276529 RepID=A0A1Y6LF99_ZYMTR|nr:unnamed protein product [Zymoseptoria tritici ST99CH_1A5]